MNIHNSNIRIKAASRINILIYHPLYKDVEEERPPCGESGNGISTNPSEDGHPCGRRLKIMGIDNVPRRNHSIFKRADSSCVDIIA